MTSLPPDPQNRNDNRAENANDGLRLYQDLAVADDEDVLEHFLCDLMHWCDRNSSDFPSSLARAIDHYETETAADLYGPSTVIGGAS